MFYSPVGCQQLIKFYYSFYKALEELKDFQYTQKE